MSKANYKRRKILRITLISFLILILLLTGGFFLYTANYYHSSDEVDTYLTTLKEEGRLLEQDNLTIIYPKVKGEKGIIFYPGGKVEETAYIPLMTSLADEGITCVIVHMPFHLAVFGVNSADLVYERLPEIKQWYLSGHSLGGAMASSYVGKHEEELEGLILLAAYPVNEAKLPTLTVYGSEDKVLNKDKLTLVGNKVQITGGNHAYYGNYGEQKGDGKATITREKQQNQCVELILNFINDTGENN